MENEKPVDGACWYAVNTNLREEDRADRNLAAWGVETFAPRIKKRRNNRYTGQPVFLSQSLFPRYIFARFEADRMLHKVRYTRGVQSVVTFNNKPLQVEIDIIALIQSQVGEDGFVRIGEELKPGDEVMVNAGAFKGIGGIFNRATKDTDRVEILLTAITYQAIVIVEREMVQRADIRFCDA